MTAISLHDYVAILIDADNVQLSAIEPVLRLSEYYGQIEILRAYGDWEDSPLSSWRAKMDALKIERRQVARVGKNATDHRLLMEAGEILGDVLFGNEVNVFVIVSGDGDFASACSFVREKGKRVIGIGNREKTAHDLRDSCEGFFYLEDLEQELSKLEKLHLIPPSAVREFFKYLFFAYHQASANKKDWVTYSQLGEKLRELVPDYEGRFGKYRLSEWLQNFENHFEFHDQMLRATNRKSDAIQRSDNQRG